MITYEEYRRLAFKFGEEKALRLFPRTIAAMWRRIKEEEE